MKNNQVISKLAVITGSSKGIGRGIVKRFLTSGEYFVLGVSRSPAVEEIKNENYFELLCDLREEASIGKVKNTIAQKLDELKVKEICFVHNFGATCHSHLLQTSSNDWDQTFEANVRIPFLFTREITPLMKAGSSHIFIGSTLSEIAVGDSCAYVASKHAIAGFMKASAIDLASVGIRTNLVCPGFTESEMADQVIEYAASANGSSVADWKKMLESKSPLKRFLKPEEIGDLVLYLANTPGINGEIIHMNGGFGLL